MSLKVQLNNFSCDTVPLNPPPPPTLGCVGSKMCNANRWQKAMCRDFTNICGWWCYSTPRAQNGKGQANGQKDVAMCETKGVCPHCPALLLFHEHKLHTYHFFEIHNSRLQYKKSQKILSSVIVIFFHKAVRFNSCKVIGLKNPTLSSQLRYKLLYELAMPTNETIKLSHRIDKYELSVVLL